MGTLSYLVAAAWQVVAPTAGQPPLCCSLEHPTNALLLTLDLLPPPLLATAYNVVVVVVVAVVAVEAVAAEVTVVLAVVSSIKRSNWPLSTLRRLTANLLCLSSCNHSQASSSCLARLVKRVNRH